MRRASCVGRLSFSFFFSLGIYGIFIRFYVFFPFPVLFSCSFLSAPYIFSFCSSLREALFFVLGRLMRLYFVALRLYFAFFLHLSFCILSSTSFPPFIEGSFINSFLLSALSTKTGSALLREAIYGKKRNKRLIAYGLLCEREMCYDLVRLRRELWATGSRVVCGHLLFDTILFSQNSFSSLRYFLGFLYSVVCPKRR